MASFLDALSKKITINVNVKEDPEPLEVVGGLAKSDMLQLVKDLQNVVKTLKRILESVQARSELFLMLNNFSDTLNVITMILNAV